MKWLHSKQRGAVCVWGSAADQTLFCQPLSAQLPCPENSLAVLGCPAQFPPLNLGWPFVKILLQCNTAFTHLCRWHFVRARGRIIDWKSGGEAWWFCMVASSPEVCVCLRDSIQPRAALNRGNPSFLSIVSSLHKTFHSFLPGLIPLYVFFCTPRFPLFSLLDLFSSSFIPWIAASHQPCRVKSPESKKELASLYLYFYF